MPIKEGEYSPFDFSYIMDSLSETTKEGPLPYSDMLWWDWVMKFYPHVAQSPMAERHIRLWEWFDNLGSVRPRPRVEIWPRGGAKSSTAELGVTRVGAKLSRRFCLYVSETQEQADKHVQSISTLFEKLHVGRALNKFGNVKGWRRDQLRTDNGFNIAGFGLDAASRGVKLDEFRPDLMIFDDIDNQNDSLKLIEKKKAIISQGLIPAGSRDCAYLFLQNMIHDEGIFAQLVDGRADFLTDREIPCIEKAINGLVTDYITLKDGTRRCIILDGEPTWEGQDREVCERMINDMGLQAFERECQHNVTNATGYFFNVDMIEYIDKIDVPDMVVMWRAWDLAGTEGGGDKTVGALIGRDKLGRYFVLDVVFGNWGTHRVWNEIEKTLASDSPKVRHRFPQDPAQAGKYQAGQMRTQFRKYNPLIKPVSGKKSVRARGFAKEVNSGNVWFVRAPWNNFVRDELKRFKEEELHQPDDFVDALSDAYSECASIKKQLQFR